MTITLGSDIAVVSVAGMVGAFVVLAALDAWPSKSARTRQNQPIHGYPALTVVLLWLSGVAIATLALAPVSINWAYAGYAAVGGAAFAIISFISGVGLLAGPTKDPTPAADEANGPQSA